MIECQTSDPVPPLTRAGKRHALFGLPPSHHATAAISPQQNVTKPAYRAQPVAGPPSRKTGRKASMSVRSRPMWCSPEGDEKRHRPPLLFKFKVFDRDLHHEVISTQSVQIEGVKRTDQKNIIGGDIVYIAV